MLYRFVVLATSLTVLLSVLGFWTLTPNYYSSLKEGILYLTTFITIIVYAYHVFKTKTLTLPSSPLTVPLLFFLGSTLLTLLANPEGRPEALAGKGLVFISLTLLTLCSMALSLPTQLFSWIERSFSFSTLILAVYSLLSLTFLYHQSFLPTFMQTQSFTPTGLYTHTASLIVLGLVVTSTKIATSHSLSRIYYLTHVTLSLISLVAIASLMLPGNPLTPNLIPYQESWGITLDALKSARTLFFGIGLANFPLFYTAVKPLSLNQLPIWNITPNSSHSELLTLIASGGIVLSTAFLILFLRSYFAHPRDSRRPLILALLLTFILLPTSLAHYLLLFLLIATTASDPHKIPLKNYLRFITPLLILLIGLGLLYQSALPFASELFMRKAQLALQNNDGKTVYDEHLKILRLSPKISSYHLSFASVNLSLASALSQKSDITDADRQNIAKLVQQSIQSAKNATYLRPSDSLAWLTLAYTYQNLIGVADGAGQFALDAYARAIALDRANPDLRLKFATILAQLYTLETDTTKKATYLTRAENEFQTAIQLKSDYPNAYYNIAKFFESLGKRDLAKQSFEKALSLIPPNTTEEARIRSELSNLGQTASSSGSTSPLPIPLDSGPIELSE